MPLLFYSVHILYISYLLFLIYIFSLSLSLSLSLSISCHSSHKLDYIFDMYLTNLESKEAFYQTLDALKSRNPPVNVKHLAGCNSSIRDITS